MRKLPRFNVDWVLRWVPRDITIDPEDPRVPVITGADWNALCDRLEMLEAEVANIKYPPGAKRAIGVDHTLTEAEAEAFKHKNLPLIPIKPCPTRPPNAPPEIYSENRDQRGWQIGDPQ